MQLELKDQLTMGTSMAGGGFAVRRKAARRFGSIAMLGACAMWLLLPAGNARAGSVFVSVTRAVDEFSTDGTLIRTLTLGAGVSFSPTDMAFGKDGNLYVLDTFSDKLQKFNPATGAYLGSLGSFPTIAPRGITLGPDGNFYVDGLDGTIVQVNSTTGVTTSVFTNSGSTTDLAFIPGTSQLVVIDGNAVCYVMNSPCVLSNPADVFATGFLDPKGLTFGPDGRLYAVGFQDVRVAGKTGGAASLFTPINSVSDGNNLAFDGLGDLWVADGGSAKVEEFSSTGALLLSFNSSGGDPLGIAVSTPEPASLLLFGSGLFVFAGMWRRWWSYSAA